MSGEEVGAVDVATPSTAPAIPENGSMASKSPRAQAYNELYNLARLTTNTEMVPRTLRGRADAAFAVMVYGAELGLEPMQSLRDIHIIEGTPACSANLMRALIHRAGHRLSWRKWTLTEVSLYGRRRDTGEALLVTYTIGDAKRAGVADKPNWKKYPRAMLAARATSELARALFADVLAGLAYTPEELGAVGEIAALDVEYTPDNVDPETGEILEPDDDELYDTDDVDEDTPAHVVQAAMFDAEDAQDAEWVRQAGEDG